MLWPVSAKSPRSPYWRIIPVRCLGSVNAIWVSDAMSKGYDGVMLLGCKYGDDYQCHFVKGSEICAKRKENIAETLNRLGVEPERVELLEVAIDEYDKVPVIIDGFVDRIVAWAPTGSRACWRRKQWYNFPAVKSASVRDGWTRGKPKL